MAGQDKIDQTNSPTGYNLPEKIRQQIPKAVEVLNNGGLIAYPTEGVFGIGCDPLNQQALQRVVDIKQRDAGKGLIIVAADYAQLADFIVVPDVGLEERLQASWPGALTWIVDARPSLPTLLTGGRTTIAVRVSSHPVVAALSHSYGKPIVSTSANFSGEPACTSIAAVRESLGDHIDLIVDAPLGGQQGATPIFDAATGQQLR